MFSTSRDHEMLMAVPASKPEDLVAGLEKTHQTGIRYPVPTYMRYTPEVAFSVPLADIFKLAAWPREEDR